MRSIAAAATLWLSSGAQAAQWTFVPALQGSETYSDNVRLQQDTLKQGDFITSIAPSFSVNAKGPNLTVNSIFAVQDIRYANQTGQAQLDKQLHADVYAKLIDNWLYVDGLASISQQSISAFGPQSNSNNLNSNQNQTDVRTTHISPYLRHAFENYAISELRYTHDTVTAASGGLSSSKIDTVAFKTDSGPAFRLVTWGVQYNDQVTHYPGTDVTFENMSGNLGYLIMPKLKLIGTAGYDNNNYAALGGVSKGYSYTGGFQWTVSSRTSLSLSAGHRYYGNTFSLNAATRTRVASWLLSYDESVTNTPSQFILPGSVDTSIYLNQLLSGTISDPTLRAQAVSQIIQNSGLPASLATAVNYFSNTTFLQKRLQASVVFTSPKSTLLFNAFDVLREPLTGEQGTSLLVGADKTDQTGVSSIFTRRLSERTNATLSLQASRTHSLTQGRTDHNQSVIFDLTRQMAQKLRGTVELRRNQLQSDQIGQTYRENAISVFLNYQL